MLSTTEELDTNTLIPNTRYPMLTTKASAIIYFTEYYPDYADDMDKLIYFQKEVTIPVIVSNEF